MEVLRAYSASCTDLFGPDSLKQLTCRELKVTRFSQQAAAHPFYNGKCEAVACPKYSTGPVFQRKC